MKNWRIIDKGLRALRAKVIETFSSAFDDGPLFSSQYLPLIYSWRSTIFQICFSIISFLIGLTDLIRLVTCWSINRHQLAYSFYEIVLSFPSSLIVMQSIIKDIVYIVSIKFIYSRSTIPYQSWECVVPDREVPLSRSDCLTYGAIGNSKFTSGYSKKVAYDCEGQETWSTK